MKKYQVIVVSEDSKGKLKVFGEATNAIDEDMAITTVLKQLYDKDYLRFRYILKIEAWIHP